MKHTLQLAGLGLMTGYLILHLNTSWLKPSVQRNFSKYNFLQWLNFFFYLHILLHVTYLYSNNTLPLIYTSMLRKESLFANSLFNLFIRQSLLIFSPSHSENIRLVRQLDLTADFGVKTITKLTPIFKLREKSKTSIQSSNPASIFCVISWCIFSNIQFLWSHLQHGILILHSLD